MVLQIKELVAGIEMEQEVVSEQVKPFGQCVMCLPYSGVHFVWLLMSTFVEYA